MNGSRHRQLLTGLVILALAIGGGVFRLVLWIYSDGGGAITLTSAGGQGMGIAAISWAVTTAFVFVLGMIVVRSIY
jgi:hypothetical protein